MRRSLHNRLIALVVASVLILFTISGIAICWLIESFLWSEFDNGMRDQLQAISQLVDQDLEGLRFEWQEGSGAETPIDVEHEVLAIWQNNQVIHTFPPQALPLNVPPEKRRAIAAVQLADATPGRAVFLTFQPRVEPGDIENSGRNEIPSAQVTMAFARPTTAIVDTINRLRLLLSAVGLLGLLATLTMTWIAINLGLRPIGKATEQIAAISSETLTERIEGGDRLPRELRPLVQTINQLLARLEATLVRERAFSSDLAHELRTPLAGLRAKLDVALSKTRSASECEETMMQCLTITEQTSTMIESLLQTTRGEQQKSPSSPINILEVVAETAEAYRASMVLQRLTLAVDIPAKTIVTGDAETARILFRNLIDNAVAYADQGSTINIAATLPSESSDLVIAISNSAQNFPPSDVQLVFERFWRADSSRSSTGKHSGLGLAICKRLAASLGGKIEATYNHQRFTILLTF